MILGTSACGTHSSTCVGAPSDSCHVWSAAAGGGITSCRAAWLVVGSQPGNIPDHGSRRASNHCWFDLAMRWLSGHVGPVHALEHDPTGALVSIQEWR
jgi:hypothetical protein